MSASDASPKPEFSRPHAADTIGRGGKPVRIAANASERAALARRFGLLSLESLAASCRLTPVAGGMIELACDLEAEATQECVVTLAPVKAGVVDSFRLRYTLEPAGLPPGEGEEIDMESEDPPETMEGGMIDLGEAVAQHFALALDPYPRAPGASFTAGPPETASNPFAILSKLKGKP